MICGEAPRRSSCESGLVSRVCIHRLPVKEIGLEQTGTPSIVRCLFSTRGSSAPCRAAGASKNHHPQPAVTISLCVPFWGALAIRDPARFRPLRSSCCLFSRRPSRCDGGASDPKTRSRRRPTERAGRHLEPRTAKRLLQLHTTHARVHERAIFAPPVFDHLGVSPRRELAPANARRRTMCPRPVRRPDTHFLRMGREGAHGSESRAEGRRLRSRARVF